MGGVNVIVLALYPTNVVINLIIYIHIRIYIYKCGLPFTIAKLVQIIPVSLWFMIVNGYYKQQTELEGDHIVALQLPNVPNDHRATSYWYHTNLLQSISCMVYVLFPSFCLV